MRKRKKRKKEKKGKGKKEKNKTILKNEKKNIKKSNTKPLKINKK